MVADLQSHFAEHEGQGGLDAGDRHFAPHELAAIRTALRQGMEQEPVGGATPYFARDPLISLVQSAMHQHAVNKLGPEVVARGDERMGDAFTPGDLVGWGVDIALSLIGRLLDGTHRFEDRPALCDLDDSRARLVLFSDWGTGMADAAGKVVQQARAYVDDADREVHVVHLGDTYYSGTEFEARRHILDLWPVSAQQSGRVGSWALNGNHDMYSGGHGYFATTLGDPRFARQQAEGRPTSWFHLKGRERWDVVGLDSAYKDPVAAFHDGQLFLFGRLGFLHGSQAGYVNDLSGAPGRRLLLLSHHQLFSAYDDDISKDNDLREKLTPTLDRQDVDAWFWGHEHDCLAYEAFRGVQAARVIGHGAVPTLVRTAPAGAPYGNGGHHLVTPAPAAGTPADHPARFVRWEYRDYEIGADGQHWAKHGFAVVDMSPDALRVRYIDTDGTVYVDETI
jgi:hypothetical protein